MMYSYSEDCRSDVMENLGAMLECAVYHMEFEANRFLHLFLASGIAMEIERGNPKYTVGMSGVELAREVVYKTFGEWIEVQEYVSLDKSPEYWGMWALAYYQTGVDLTFEQLLGYVEFDTILTLYDSLHEADIEKFVDAIDVRIEYIRATKETSLARLRRLRGYSQRILAEESGVSLRMIQLYEQRQNDINKAQAETLLRLARALECTMEQLLI